MKIKTILVAFSLIAIQMNVFAQKGELSSAKSNYEKFVQLKDAGSLALAMPSIKSAKTSIDKASVNEKTANDPAVWTYKALIYADLAIQDSTESSAKTLEEAKVAYKKAIDIELEANKISTVTKTSGDMTINGSENKNIQYNSNIQSSIIVKNQFLKRVEELFAQYELNKGVKAYQSQNFKDAYAAFSNSLNYRPGDTTITYYAGLSAINAQNYPAAIERYKALLNTNFSANNQLALDLSRIYAIQKDTLMAIETAGIYAQKFNDSQLATQEIELSLMSGKEKQILSKISQQSAKDPKNKLYHFYLGIAYATLKDYKNSEASYQNALVIDPNYEDAILNLSSTILNNGIDMYNTANKLPSNKQKEYDAMMVKAQAEFERAYPLLQRAVTINPKSVNAWENLKTYYIIKRNQAKVDEIKKTIDGLQ